MAYSGDSAAQFVAVVDLILTLWYRIRHESKREGPEPFCLPSLVCVFCSDPSCWTSAVIVAVAAASVATTTPIHTWLVNEACAAAKPVASRLPMIIATR